MAKAMNPVDAEAWVQERLARSDLIRHYFDLRELGLDPEEGSEAVRSLAQMYLIGRCLALSTVAARKVGRDRLVSFLWPDGRLMHSVVACTPQYAGEPLRGDCVDVLGRCRLSEIEADLAAAIAPVTVEIGVGFEDRDLMDGEVDALELVFRQLPWLRGALLMAVPDEAGPRAFLDAAAWARNVRPRPEDVGSAISPSV
ncbi:hypothetical protein [Methylobacterium fujisawaense]|jgi:hypothetical protein